jgi:anion transporter
MEAQIVQASSDSRALTIQVPLEFKKYLALIFALAVGCAIWNVPPAGPIDEKGMHFLATLAVAVTLWMFELFDEYVVALALLLSWVVSDIVPSKVALAGFSENSWFFVIGALGIGAAVSKTGLLYRLSDQVLSRIPLHYYRTYTFFLFASGLLTTPLLPTGKARAVIAVPVSQAISEANGFAHRSNGSAALSLAAVTGFTQMSFMFLTGSESCLIGWNLLPPASKSEFGWTMWFLAALPAVVVIFLFVFGSIHLLFPLKAHDKANISNKALRPQLKNLGPLTKAEWIALLTLALTLTGWLTMPLHGVNEAWVALAALSMFLLTGVLDKNGFKNLDWGLILFFGIVISMATVSAHLKVDRWFMKVIEPVLGSFSLGPLSFLAAVLLLVGFARLFIRKAAVVTFFTLTLLPSGQDFGIHPGVLLLTILMANECFFLPYQDGPYQVAYSSTQGTAFSHAQARKLMLAKCLATFAAIAVSIPYWRLLGLIN